MPPAKKSKLVPIVIVGAIALVSIPCVLCIIGTIITRLFPPDPNATAEGRTEIRAYNDRVAALVAGFPDPSGPAVPCPAEVLRAGHAHEDGSGRMYIPSLRYETLQRWASGAAEEPEDDGFGWLDSMERVDPDELEDYEVGNARFRVNTWAQQRYVAVFRAGIARPPVVGDGRFESGLFIGRLVILDTQTKDAVCHAPVAAQNTDTVSVGGIMNPDDADDAVQGDLREQLQIAATQALRSISAELYLGTSPTIGQ